MDGEGRKLGDNGKRLGSGDCSGSRVRRMLDTDDC